MEGRAPRRPMSEVTRGGLPELALHFVNDLDFGELVSFVPGVSFDYLQHCRGKTKHHGLSSC